MKPLTIGVGVDSITLDIIITLQNLNDLNRIQDIYDGELSKNLETAYKLLSEDVGGEISIDGKREDAEKILSIAKDLDARLNFRLGGNAAQKTVALDRLGVQALPLTGISKEVLSKTKEEQNIFEDINTKYSLDLNRRKPASYVFQSVGTERYILADGKGRRIEQLRDYLSDLPKIVGSISNDLGGIDALSLVGWHVLFGNRFTQDDLEFVESIIGELKEETDAILFTDAGGFEDFKDAGKDRLFQIYSLFDMLSMNEIEASNIATKCNYETEHHFEDLACVYESLESVSTAWMHTKTYQASVSSSFSKETLSKTQDFAALAGLYRVETGGYPTPQDIAGLKNERNISKEGLKTVEKIEDNYSNFLKDEFAVTPCYEPKNFISTTGSGDVSGAAYLYSILKSLRTNS